MSSAPIHIFEPSQYDLLREAGKLAGEVLHLCGEMIKPGVTPLEIDEFCEQWIRDKGHTPTFKGYHGFPNALCFSVNDQIVHGIPNTKPLRAGDICSLDVGVTITEKFNGEDIWYVGDNAFTFPCGDISPKTEKLLMHTNQALWAGINAIEKNAYVSDISKAVEEIAQQNRYGNVKEFGGHGIGPTYHCEPFIPNFSNFFNHVADTQIEPGMVLAVEPMFNIGVDDVKKHKDGWTISTADRKNSAHFEHSVLVLEDGIEVITNARNTQGYFS